MGLLDKVKSATGLGLNPDEAYHRAYEKGVLLGKYDVASEMFSKAAEKYEEASRSELARRARANQFLYLFIGTKDLSHIDKILPHLETLPDIEELGSETVKIPVGELLTELQARKFEVAAFGSSGNLVQAQALHGKAAAQFRDIIKSKLKTYALVPAPRSQRYCRGAILPAPGLRIVLSRSRRTGCGSRASSRETESGSARFQARQR